MAAEAPAAASVVEQAEPQAELPTEPFDTYAAEIQDAFVAVETSPPEAKPEPAAETAPAQEDEELLLLQPWPSHANNTLARFLSANGDTSPPPPPEALQPPPVHDEDPPFDPPDVNDDIFLGKPSEPSEAAESSDPAPLPEMNYGRRSTDRWAPAISIHASWDRADIAASFSKLADDRRMARTDIQVARGGMEAAIERCSKGPSPDLLLIDTTLAGSEIIAGLDRLSYVIAPTTKVVILGAVNDVSLLRELARRNVSQYLLGQSSPDRIIRTVCGLYAASDRSRVIAVIGARGGVGASSIAHNLAWSIAERQQISTSLIDLDLAFGPASFDLKTELTHSLADALAAPANVNDEYIERIGVKQSSRLSVIAAPPALAREVRIDAYAIDVLVAHVRRASAYVILDLPHDWNSWVRHALISADDVVVVAAPDLASMRNTQNILGALKSVRPKGSEPILLLSMVGEPGRPGVSLKDFADAADTEPLASIPFDAALFGLSQIKSLPIGAVAPRAETAKTIDALACSLTGRPLAKRPKPSRAEEKPAPEKRAPTLKQPERRREDVPLDNAKRPFTFAPAKGVPNAAIEPLELRELVSKPAEEDALAKLRSAALGEPAKPVKSAPPRRGRRGTLRAAALILLLLSAAWYAQTREIAAANPAAGGSVTAP